jgi:hypothetical protein
MSLPPVLRTSVTPPELELIACQEMIEIFPLIAMEKTAFISVHASRTAYIHCYTYLSGRVWTFAATS